jgi:hypothetical protein
MPVSRWSSDMDRLQDRISRALGTAARAIGSTADAFRPSSAADPLAPANRFLRLPVAFAPADGRFGHANAYGAALWQGMFDSAYTQPGDYIVQADGTWFIAAQQRLLPALCVRATRTVSFARAAAASASGVNGYGGITRATATRLLTNWPASVLGVSGGGRPDAALPSDSAIPFWTVLMPAFGSIVLRPADLMTDDLGRTAAISAAELTELGWRLTVKQATT